MSRYLTVLSRLGSDRKAVTALEYGLIAALIAVAIIAAVTTLGTNLAATFTNLSGHFGAAVGK